jgi:tRNA(fMet)-specific endonuclease VapC
MRYLIDSNIWVEYLKRMPRSAAVRRKLRSIPKSHVALCSVVKAELLYGAEKSAQRLRSLDRLARLFGAYE